MNNNPYSWNTVNPDLCYGRNDIITDLLSGLPGSQRLSFGIAGGRRMGKTTLLRRVEKDIADDVEQWRKGGLLVVPVYIDGLALPRPLTPAHIWRLIATEILHKLPDNNANSVDEIVEFYDFKQLITPILLSLPERPRVIVFFDEIETITATDWADSFFANWRALLSQTPDLSEFFSAVFAGAREMRALQIDIGSPLKDILDWFNLSPLEYADACALMQEPINHEWPEVFLKKAYSLSGGHPMLLQYLMQQVCLTYPDHPEEFLDEAAAIFDRKRRWQFSEWWNRYLTPTAQRIYSRLPDDGSSLDKRSLTREFGVSETNEALNILQHVGLLFEEDDGFAFRYAGEMFRNWYRKEGTLPTAFGHDPEIYNRLYKVDQGIAGKYVSAWKILGVDLPNYSGAVVEIRGIMEYIEQKFAPNELVAADPNFKLEKNCTEPTRRQKLRYLLRNQYPSEKIKEIISDYALFEMQCDQLAQTASIAYRTVSSLAHETAPRDLAFRTLKQWDGILVQVIPNGE